MKKIFATFLFLTFLACGMAQGTLPPLPKLLDPPAAQIPTDIGRDAFGLPVRWSYRTVFPPNKKNPPPPGDAIDDLIARMPIHGVMPGREVLIRSQRVPMNGIFVLKNGSQLLRLRVELISSLEVVFSVGDEPILYRYQLPPGNDTPTP